MKVEFLHILLYVVQIATDESSGIVGGITPRRQFETSFAMYASREVEISRGFRIPGNSTCSLQGSKQYIILFFREDLVKLSV